MIGAFNWIATANIEKCIFLFYHFSDGGLSPPSYSDFQGKLTIKYNCKSTTTTTIIIIIILKKKNPR